MLCSPLRTRSSTVSPLPDISSVVFSFWDRIQCCIRLFWWDPMFLSSLPAGPMPGFPLPKVSNVVFPSSSGVQRRSPLLMRSSVVLVSSVRIQCGFPLLLWYPVLCSSLREVSSVLLSHFGGVYRCTLLFRWYPVLCSSPPAGFTTVISISGRINAVLPVESSPVLSTIAGNMCCDFF